jgi:hypothetical protein
LAGFRSVFLPHCTAGCSPRQVAVEGVAHPPEAKRLTPTPSIVRASKVPGSPAPGAVSRSKPGPVRPSAPAEWCRSWNSAHLCAKLGTQWPQTRLSGSPRQA